MEQIGQSAVKRLWRQKSELTSGQGIRRLLSWPAVATALISDLHLGTTSGSDVLRRTPALERLVDRLATVDELVLLGDLLELREAALRDVLRAARPVLAEIGRALAGRRITVVAGNHDYQLAASLLDRLAASDGNTLALETVAAPPPFGPLAEVADALGGDVRLAHPGVWIRPDVFAIHGHYLDAHNTVPTLERLAVGVVERLVGGLPAGPLRPADYEAVLAPVYELAYSFAQASPAARKLVGGGPSVRAWRRLAGSSGARPGLHVRLAAAALVGGGVAVLNRAGVGPLKPDLSATELRRAGLEAMAAVVARLGIGADHVVFGHTHRAGPYPGDEGWTLPGGTRLINTGSWVAEPTFLGGVPHESPYFPGTWVLVPDSGPPRLERLLDEIPAP